MLGQLLAKVIGTQNDRELKKLWPIVAKINALVPTITPLSDAELLAKTGAGGDHHARRGCAEVAGELRHKREQQECGARM